MFKTLANAYTAPLGSPAALVGMVIIDRLFTKVVFARLA